MSAVERLEGVVRRGCEIEIGWLRGPEERCAAATGWDDIDEALSDGWTRGALHEWFGVAESDSSVGGESGDLRRRTWTPPLLPLVHLVERFLDDCGSQRRAVWIGRRCFPYGGVLLGAGGDPRRLERSLFVAAERPADRLWAIDLSLRCPAVGVVAADGSGLDMAATRRIQLVARRCETPALLARPPWETRELSAAQTRWMVRWDEGTEEQSRDRQGAVTAKFEEREDESEMNPRWSVELLRCKGASLDSRPRVWAMEWDRGEGALRLLAPLAGAAGDAGVCTDERRYKQA